MKPRRLLLFLLAGVAGVVLANAPLRVSRVVSDGSDPSTAMVAKAARFRAGPAALSAGSPGHIDAHAVLREPVSPYPAGFPPDKILFSSDQSGGAMIQLSGAQVHVGVAHVFARAIAAAEAAGVVLDLLLLPPHAATAAAIASRQQPRPGALREKVDGLGDTGGFTEKGSDSVGVLFIKSKTTVLLTVATAGVKADAVAAVAKKIPAKV